jgi:hypothetical protein
LASLPWTKIRLSNGAVKGMNNKMESISHRSFGFRTAENFIAAIYHCCARLPLPASANYIFGRGTVAKLEIYSNKPKNPVLG